ncbi:MAG: hypothetical protein CVU59_05520 [Deltaproteobacteria bacterium HGW-Deltaproteobacteria-17]|nr:MAG: hypothetical protein CVU59_05520 [Deltaproteobacteria bacterium HGW-Deltaproteobacteria-17]
MRCMRRSLILFSFLLMVAAGCTRHDACPRIPLQQQVREILAESPDNRLDIFVTDTVLLVNGAPVGKIRGGRFTDASDRAVYPPLLESIYQEFSRRGSDPYTEMLIYIHEKHPRTLIDLVYRTAARTQLAPVILVPVNFIRTRCDKPKQAEPKVAAGPVSGLLVRQEKDRILVNGQAVLTLENGAMPAGALDADGIICPALLKVLADHLATLPRDAVPVLHLTLEADPEITKYILVTAGKAGISRFKTVRVIE